MITGYGLGGVALAGLVVGLNNNTNPSEADYRQHQQRVALREVACPDARRDLVINSPSWQKNDVGVAAYHWFSIQNQSRQHAYSAIPVRFTYYSDSGHEAGHLDKVIDKATGPQETLHLEGSDPIRF